MTEFVAGECFAETAKGSDNFISMSKGGFKRVRGEMRKQGKDRGEIRGRERMGENGKPGKGRSGCREEGKNWRSRYRVLVCCFWDRFGSWTGRMIEEFSV
jgi:hypothetical protein